MLKSWPRHETGPPGTCQGPRGPRAGAPPHPQGHPRKIRAQAQIPDVQNGDPRSGLLPAPLCGAGRERRVGAPQRGRVLRDGAGPARGAAPRRVRSRSTREVTLLVQFYRPGVRIRAEPETINTVRSYELRYKPASKELSVTAWNIEISSWERCCNGKPGIEGKGEHV